MNPEPYVPRSYQSALLDDLRDGQQIILLFGPRQVGKTTLAHSVMAELGLKTLSLNADLMPNLDALASRDLQRLEGLISDYECLFIDEAQRIPEIGINLKILHDHFPKLRILVTGSSSLELASGTREALTGRSLSYLLYPIAVQELRKLHSPFELQQQLEEQLIFGMYPRIRSLRNYEQKIRYLRELVSAYLYKDVLELANIRHADKLIALLRLLAFQIGGQVSLSELGKQLGLSKETVSTYLDLLEKSFVIFRLNGFSRNLRKEVSKSSKYFFYDLGVRNALIENFNLLSQRDDQGQLWENFLMVERRKHQDYTFGYQNRYFWRTYDQQEIDYIEESGGQLRAYEFKWNRQKRSKVPSAWQTAYPAAQFQTVTPDDYVDFVG